MSCWHKKIIEEAALFSSVLRSFEEIPPFPPYPLPSHILECWTPLKLFPAFWTTLVSEEPRAAGLAGLAGLAGPGLRAAQWWEGQDGEGCETWGILRCLALCLRAQRTGRKGNPWIKTSQLTGHCRLQVIGANLEKNSGLPLPNAAWISVRLLWAC